MKALCLSLLVAILLVACNQSEKPNSQQPEEVSSKLIFTTDKRLETLYIAFLLADYPIVSPHQSSYKQDAEQYFAPYKEHDAVKLLSILMYRGLNFDYAVNWLFQYSDFPGFELENEINYPFESREMDADSLQILSELLSDFYEEAGCEAFFSKQATYLTEMVSTVEAQFEASKLIQAIEDYFGVEKNAEYQVVLSPLLHNGGFAIEKQMEAALYALVGPSGLNDSMPVFDKQYLEYDLVIHEFSHSFANEIVDRYMQEALPLKALYYDEVSQLVADEGYSSFEGYMYELIVCSTTIRIAALLYGEEVVPALLEYEQSVGFALVEEVLDLLHKYEAQRSKYGQFEAYYPLLLDSLKN